MAIISNNKKFIFLHIPKTAGTSIRRVLMQYQSNRPERPEEWHEDMKDTKKKIDSQLFEQYFKFTFIRNPWDRLYSSYQFITQKPLNAIERIPQEYYRSIGFKKWLLEEKFYVPNNIEPLPTLKPIQYKNLLDWMTDDDGKMLVDFYGRLENINEDIKIISEKLNIPIELQKTASSKRETDYRKVYDNEMIDFVYKNHKRDIEYFGYEF